MLPVATGLRPLVSKHRRDVVQPHWLRLVGKAMLHIRTTHRRSALRPQRQIIPAQVLEAVHLLLDDVCVITDATAEKTRRLEHGRINALVAERVRRLCRNSADMLPRRLPIWKDISNTADGLYRYIFGHAPDSILLILPIPVRLRSIGAWRSLVAHLTGGQEVTGSNPVAPTIQTVARNASEAHPP